jgi:hypothetical protein
LFDAGEPIIGRMAVLTNFSTVVLEATGAVSGSFPWSRLREN